MQYASPSQRVKAYWFDFVLVTSVILGVGRIFWEFAPGTDVRVDAMQFYTEKDFNNFKVTSVFAISFILLYSVGLLMSKWRGTLGQRLFGVYVGRPDGSKIRIREGFNLLIVSWMKCLIIFGLGPLMGYLGAAIGASIAGLMVPVLLLIAIPAFAWRSPERAGVYEHMANVRYFKRESIEKLPS